MNSGTKRSENYCLTTDNQRQILVQFFNDGMRSTLDTEKISEASKVAGLSVQRVKKWIGNHKAKEIRKASRGEEDPGEDNEAAREKKRFKGERKISARSMFYRNLSRDGRLKGFKNNAERNKFFAREWELADDEMKKTMEEEAEKFNRYELNEMNEEEMAFLVKQHKKKLLHQISTLESLGVEISIMLLDGPKLENFGSARGLAFLYAHPSLNADFKKFYDVADENEKKTYTYKDLQVVFNEAYAEAVKIDNARVPGKWLDNKSGNRYKLLPQPTSIKRLNIVSDKDGLLLFFCHFFEDDDDIVEVKSDFVKDVQISLKVLSD